MTEKKDREWTYEIDPGTYPASAVPPLDYRKRQRLQRGMEIVMGLLEKAGEAGVTRKEIADAVYDSGDKYGNRTTTRVLRKLRTEEITFQRRDGVYMRYWLRYWLAAHAPEDAR